MAELTEKQKEILAKAAAEEAAAEAAAKAAKENGRIVQLAPYQDRMYALTSSGRIFCRVADPRASNDGRGGERFTWRPVELPF